MKNKESLEGALYDIEHALDMYAVSFATLPAEMIYEKDALVSMMPVLKKCHVYLVGYVPIIDLINIEYKANVLSMEYSILGKKCILNLEVPKGFILKEGNEEYVLVNGKGEQFWPDSVWIQNELRKITDTINFEVLYIGKAYGVDGSRNALDRLQNHERLQEIALRGVPNGYKLTLLLLEVGTNDNLVTLFNPYAKSSEEGPSRIKSGLNKLFNTTEKERIALYEAVLIRYFSPTYNIEFKNSFPSTELKILKDCYDKDFSAVVAEICFDELPFFLFSETVKASHYHIAKFDLHQKVERRVFFSLE